MEGDIVVILQNLWYCKLSPCQTFESLPPETLDNYYKLPVNVLNPPEISQPQIAENHQLQNCREIRNNSLYNLLLYLFWDCIVRKNDWIYPHSPTYLNVTDLLLRQLFFRSYKAMLKLFGMSKDSFLTRLPGSKHERNWMVENQSKAKVTFYPFSLSWFYAVIYCYVFVIMVYR